MMHVRGWQQCIRKGDSMARSNERQEGYFILESVDEETGKRIQLHYWIKGGRFYSSTETEEGTRWKGRISEKSYICALEESRNA